MFGLSLLVAYTAASYLVIQRTSQHIYSLAEIRSQNKMSNVNVGVIFGGGVSEDRPLPLVKDRLDTAAELLRQNIIKKLIISGDNRTLEYNEPQVMFEYLTKEKNINSDMLQVDFAGRSTYETCERAKKIFGVDQALLITESTHLPRALYLCRHFGITAYGVKSDGQASAGLQVGQRWREILARDKAIFNTYIYGERTILGEPIDLEL